jgi:hypothetical protein
LRPELQLFASGNTGCVNFKYLFTVLHS